MYYVRAYERMHSCVCVRRQSAVHLSVCRYECSHAFGMRAGIRASVCLSVCLRAYIRSRVYGYECMSVYGTCLHTCVDI